MFLLIFNWSRFLPETWTRVYDVNW